MDLLAYFRVLRRRWVLILALMLVGAGLGYASRQLDQGPGREPTYYKATSTLQLDTSSGSSSQDQGYTSVEQVAPLVTAGDVPDAVAKQLGTAESGRQLAEQVVTLTNSVPST